MNAFTASRIGDSRWSGPEWARHIAGKAMTERMAPPRRTSVLPELMETAWWKRAVVDLTFLP